MAKKKTYYDMTKEEIIKKEKEKLTDRFKDLEEKTKKSVESLMDESAFMAASLFELREIINEKGYTEEYQNGENQKGTKKCSEVEIYINLSKNYMAIMKQLTDLLPRGTPKVENDGFDEFVGDRDD
ncbi:hypothetical protein [Anaerocolumna jejuensis]|uniref:hypothetical protein n=1 Tax=Anaerocolumna jejuensis TaxID=259063 RepID=UPI003F7C5EE9